MTKTASNATTRIAGRILVVHVLTWLLLVTSSSAQDQTILIKNGRVFDGSGNPWIGADVLVRNDRVAAVGNLTSASADVVVDATGLYVSPGFIDTHSHAARGLADAELSDAEPLLAMGLTTVFVNPDGGGPIDIGRQQAALLEHGLGVNVAQLVPHGAIRTAVLGRANRAATPDEMERMKRLVDTGMAAGAWGLSSGTFYVPGSYAPPAELQTLAEVVARYSGTYTSHIRDESTYNVGLIAAVDEVIDVGRHAAIPVVLTHVKALGPFVWGFGPAVVQRVQRARGQGVQVFADQYPYAASSTGLAAALVPRWALAGGRDSLRARLKTPETNARIRTNMIENLARRGGPGRIQLSRYEADPSIEGKLLSDVAKARDLNPIELSLDLISRGNPRIVSYNMADEDIEALMIQPWTMTSSDGGLVRMGVGVPHPRGYGAFARKIRVYVKEKAVISLEHAIRSATSLPAHVYGLPHRGHIHPGAAADLVVFDLEAVRDAATFIAPHQYARGMVHVIVNGKFAIKNGAFTGLRSGRVLKKNRQ